MPERTRWPPSAGDARAMVDAFKAVGDVPTKELVRAIRAAPGAWAGAKINDDWTLIWWVVSSVGEGESGYPPWNARAEALVSALLDAGADPSAKNSNNRSSALGSAVKYNMVEAAQLLLEAGADPVDPAAGTPLFHQARSPGMVRTLVAHDGSSLEYRGGKAWPYRGKSPFDKRGPSRYTFLATPLVRVAHACMRASYRGTVGAAAAAATLVELLRAGADPRAEADGGGTFLDMIDLRGEIAGDGFKRLDGRRRIGVAGRVAAIAVQLQMHLTALIAEKQAARAALRAVMSRQELQAGIYLKTVTAFTGDDMARITVLDETLARLLAIVKSNSVRVASYQRSLR